VAKIILVRHGETDWNRIRRIQGSESDTPLNETGQRQAEALAARLKDDKITAIFSSPLQRALRTAQTIAACHQLEVTALPSLIEIKVGELEGRMASDLLTRFDEFLCGDGREKASRQPPGGETAEDVQKRAWATIVDLAAQQPEGTLVVVSHYFVIMTIICRVLNLPVSQMVRLRLSTGTISAFTIDNDKLRLELFNDGCHNLKL
jgi:broad specificity phosphatase PhoE